ncbi:arginine--tRNA ligase, partial [Salmonella enterica subsp. enterica serovar Montevideo]
REPHRVAFYLGDLAAAFHAFFNLGNDRTDKRIVLAHDPETSGARLFMAANIGQVIANGLGLMAVEAAAQM